MLDITDELEEAQRILASQDVVAQGRCREMAEKLRRCARDPRVLGQQQAQALKLAQALERLLAEA